MIVTVTVTMTVPLRRRCSCNASAGYSFNSEVGGFCVRYYRISDEVVEVPSDIDSMIPFFSGVSNVLCLLPSDVFSSMHMYMSGRIIDIITQIRMHCSAFLQYSNLYRISGSSLAAYIQRQYASTLVLRSLQTRPWCQESTLNHVSHTHI